MFREFVGFVEFITAVFLLMIKVTLSTLIAGYVFHYMYVYVISEKFYVPLTVHDARVIMMFFYFFKSLLFTRVSTGKNNLDLGEATREIVIEACMPLLFLAAALPLLWLL